ncbi:MAG TPA: ABC transporter ATP-binding protein [Ktedonobacteraceae bacterium]|jgi:peptide/nickel transport system ATP-binding protein|nr:ABC transporter ATP-binding protein [Ktedonobacteraceae bacterium]
MSTKITTSTTEEPILEAVHLKKDFPLRKVKLFGAAEAVHAVEDVTLVLRSGHATALVGESGSGKTTVARLLARLYAPTSGTIRYREEVIKARGERALQGYRRHVQIVFQDPFSSLNPMHTVRHHLSRPLRIYGHAHTASEEMQLITSLLERVNLTPAEQFIPKFPHQLSGGQRQRIAIARALAARPSVLLADEPVSMLDVSIRLDILNLLTRLKEEEQLALLYITHDLASARYFAEETLVMYAGQMVEGGPSEEVIQQAKHPYTQLLLSSAPDPDRFGSSGLQGNHKVAPWIPAKQVVSGNGSGDVPSLIKPPGGCRFHPRCPYAMPVCQQQFPPRRELGRGHWVHCFLYGGAHKTDAKPSTDVTDLQGQGGLEQSRSLNSRESIQ